MSGSRQRLPKPVFGDSGQMAVELACLMPVALVVAVIVFNLVRFVEACAVFDRAALDAVVLQGVAPSGEQSLVSGVEAVRASIADSFEEMPSCDIEVSARTLSDIEGGSIAVNPLLTRYVCKLTFYPWPLSFAVAGIDARIPVALTHEKSLVVDRFRAGVVI